MDKVVFKDLMGRAGLPQVAYVVARRRARAWPLADRVARLGLPVLGQAGAAGLVGRHRARRRAGELEAAIEAAARATTRA